MHLVWHEAKEERISLEISKMKMGMGMESSDVRRWKRGSSGRDVYNGLCACGLTLGERYSPTVTDKQKRHENNKY